MHVLSEFRLFNRHVPAPHFSFFVSFALLLISVTYFSVLLRSGAAVCCGSPCSLSVVFFFFFFGFWFFFFFFFVIFFFFFLFFFFFFSMALCLIDLSIRQFYLNFRGF